MDDLVRQNFGESESLWNPKCFDRLYSLREGSQIVAVCTLQKWSGGWILGDLCVFEKRKGHATRLVNKVIQKVRGDTLWVDTNEQSRGIFEKDPRWQRTNTGPWKPTGVSFVYH